MALVVEDGTGLSNAESYLAVADADTYHVNFGNTSWASASGGAKEVALRQATQYLDSRFGLAWKGRKINATMSLDWPRSGVRVDDYAVDDDFVPPEIENATAILALSALTETLTPDSESPDGLILGEMIQIGPIKLDTDYGGATSTKRYRLVEELIAPLLHWGTELVRA